MSAQRLRDAATRVRHAPDQYPTGVGLALANWLDAQADTTCDCGVDEFALAVAYQILGGTR
jgi:hypothetical protein